MDDPTEQPTSPLPESSPSEALLAGSPLLEIPVEADDVIREKRRKRVFLTTVALIAVGIAAYSYKRYNDPIEAQKSFDAAQRLYALAEYDQTIVACTRAISRRPNFPEAYMLRGRAHVASYDAEHSIPDFTKAIELKPNDTGVRMDRASAYIAMKEYKEAMADADAALALDPELGRAYNVRGTARRALGEVEAAAAEFKRAVEFEPSSENYIQLGATNQLLGKHEEAVEDFSEAIRLDPDQAQVYFARAASERELGDLDAAQADHDQARYLDSR